MGFFDREEFIWKDVLSVGYRALVLFGTWLLEYLVRGVGANVERVLDGLRAGRDL